MQKVIKSIEKFVENRMKGEATGHDWYHVARVRKTALLIAKNERGVDLFLVEAAALMHDLGDWKVTSGRLTERQVIEQACDEIGIDPTYKEKISEIILGVSYSNNLGSKKKLSLEGRIVQDADRLEALGAIGIARAFAFGGKKGRVIYDPQIKPVKFESTSSYRNATSPTINHFYEKLFLLRGQLNTKTAKEIALKREKFMKEFLKEFYNEWEGKV